MKVTNVITDHLSIPAVNFDRVHRVGKIMNQRPRDIVAKFARFTERESVFRARRKLKGMNIFINEDYCRGTMDVRRNQMDNIREARRNGKIAFFNYRTLVVRDASRGGGVRRGARHGARAVNTTTAPAPAYTPP